jgi:4-hydroxybenzoate polyprenyltransferase
MKGVIILRLTILLLFIGSIYAAAYTYRTDHWSFWPNVVLMIIFGSMLTSDDEAQG